MIFTLILPLTVYPKGKRRKEESHYLQNLYHLLTLQTHFSHPFRRFMNIKYHNGRVEQKMYSDIPSGNHFK